MGVEEASAGVVVDTIILVAAEAATVEDLMVCFHLSKIDSQD